MIHVSSQLVLKTLLGDSLPEKDTSTTTTTTMVTFVTAGLPQAASMSVPMAAAQGSNKQSPIHVLPRPISLNLRFEIGTGLNDQLI